MIILDGKHCARKIEEDIRTLMTKYFSPGSGRSAPKLCVVLVGDNPASAVYVRTKRKKAESLGLKFEIKKFPEDATQEEVAEALRAYSSDNTCDGVFLQLPVPKHLDARALLDCIDPAKDADGLTPYNFGKLLGGDDGAFLPCTPRGIMLLLRHYDIDPKGKNVTIVGRSNIVGKPLAILMLRAHATPTICHTRTVNLEEHVKRADIVVAAAGCPELVKGSWIKKDAVVIDSGFSKDPDGVIFGDVEYESACRRASHITPVPGGVGPMTVICLMLQCVEAAVKRRC